jgi:hypothetical protein
LTSDDFWSHSKEETCYQKMALQWAWYPLKLMLRFLKLQYFSGYRRASIRKSTFWLVGCMVFSATFNNISAISWRSVLLGEETGVPEENHRPTTCHWTTLSHDVLSKQNISLGFTKVLLCILQVANCITIPILQMIQQIFIEAN